MEKIEMKIQLYSQYHYEAEMIYQLAMGNRLVKK